MKNPMKQTPVPERRRFDQTFKREAVINWLQSGKSAAAVGEELGINANFLYAWRKLVPEVTSTGKSSVKPGSVADLQSQLEAAQRELRHVREQCAILKKTLGILSEPSSNGMNGSVR
jgi:transposase-like protein